MGAERFETPSDLLNNRCDPDGFDFETTREVVPLEGMIGQERAFSALELALDVQEPGFNLFVSGPPGTGRNSALRAHVEKVAGRGKVPPDWGYVHNFQEPSHPVPISLPCGWMRVFAADMGELVDTIRRDVPRVFESSEYTERMEAAMQGLQARRQEMTAAMEKAALQAGFTLGSTPAGITPIPVKDGRPLSEADYAALPEAERELMRERAAQLQNVINRTLADIRRLGKAAVEEGREVDREIVLFTLTPIVDELQERYSDFPEIVAYLDRVEADMVDNLDHLKPREPAPTPSGQPAADEDTFARYKINDLVDNTTCEYAPVVFEHNPTYYNLFGRIDYLARMGTFTTNHTMVKSGAIHEANGGYLILQARDLLADPLSWQTLKRTLRSREIRIENIGERYNPLPSSTLRPQPIPLDAKIVMVGTPDVLRLLQSFDEDFRRYFKITAYFDTFMDRTLENVAKYAAFVSARCRDGGLRPFHKTAVARIIDYSSRLAEHQEKLTTRFMDVADIITEADYWASSAESGVVMGDDVEKAIEQRRYRSSLTEDRLRELIEDGTIHISTEGEAVGQVNGLAVLTLGDTSFGKPSRITARVSLGRGQLVNIERETKLSGRIHDKGFVILTGYLKGKYGYDKPLSLNASIGFEQSYSEVDGDSASSAELYTLLSAASGMPIAQGIAVTGSVDQNGDVLAIGGATQKIEGFFAVCKARGLNSRQGVIVPRDNLRHLALNDEVVAAVAAGRFNVYGVSTIDEGIEVLTGVPAGDRQDDGGYPEGTVHQRVEQRLKELAQSARKFRLADRRERDPEELGASEPTASAEETPG